MANKIVGEQTSFAAGMSFSNKEGQPNSYAFGRAIDHRSDPKKVDVNPKSLLDSGSVVTDLPMWGERACTRTFAYGNTGKLYQSTSGGSWSLVHTAAGSQGNGMAYFTSDRALYYAQNTTFGRLLDACTESTFYDDFLGSEGGAPTNTKSIDFEASSSMYASRADTTSTSITLDLTLEAYIAPESLPATGDTMTLISKWDENSDERSYKMDIGTVSDFFGDGSDGALTISSNTTEAPIDSACTGTLASYSLTATNASFAADQEIMIHQSRGTGAGTVQFTSIQSYTAGTITTTDALTATFTSGAQVRVLKKYTDVTINAAYTAKDWNGSTGGIIGWYGSGTLTFGASGKIIVDGSIGASTTSKPATPAGGTGGGFRGGYGAINDSTVPGQAGEGYNASVTVTTSANTSGGGGGARSSNERVGGGGAGHATAGGAGFGSGGTHGAGGLVGVDSATLTTLHFGGGGGGASSGGSKTGGGGSGGGIVSIFQTTITAGGLGISANGGLGGADFDNPNNSGGGGGAGGSILLKCETATLGTSLVTASGGSGGAIGSGSAGGAGANGRIHLDYSTSYTGTTSPTLDVAEDSTLATGDGYALRLLISDDGSTTETYSKEITDNISLGDWGRWAVTWDASLSTAEFFKNAVSLGTKTGSMTSIYNSTSVFGIACDFDTTAQNFYDGLMDDTRVWNDIRTDSELLNWNDRVLVGTEANLIAYYEFTSDVTDSQTSGYNDLTAYNTPTYSDDVPFSGLTTRNDEDQRNEQTGQTYTLAVAIDEGATHRQTFVPAKDPQESIEIDISDAGTGDWTLTVHDSLNREVAALTVVNGDLNTGFFEFVFASVWRPIIGASYHFHLTSTVADGVVVTGTTVDLETVRYRSHYQFLVSDEYHPIAQHLDFMVMGNERYLAKFEAGDTYDPHKLTFPSGYRVRCLAFWREFVAIGCWKGDAITDYDDGRIFFWDGISDTYNFSINVPEGGVNTMFGTQDVLFIVAGYTGEILVYNGGGAAQKYHKIPKIKRDKYVEVAPGSMNMWRTNIHLGVNLNTDSEEIHKGIYSIGTAQREYPVSLGFDYPTSLGDQTISTVKTSMVFPSGQDLYVGWQNSNTYGIDKISVDNDSYPEATLEMLITDLSSVSDDDLGLVIRADFEALEAGESIRVKYKADRESTWKTSDYEASTGAMDVRLPIKERMKEVQVAIDWASTVSTQATLLGLTLEVDKEQQSGRRS